MKVFANIIVWLGLLVGGFSAFHVFFDKGGNISAQEALPALFVGIVLLLFGFILTLKATKKA